MSGRGLKVLSIIFTILLTFTSLNGAGKVTGGSDHTMPSWFKQSFLDMNEDVLRS